MKRRLDLVRRCTVWVSLGILLAALNAAPARAAGKPIVIGGTLGLTGAFAGPSAEYKAVYKYWQNEVNKKGGLLVLLSHESESKGRSGGGV